LNVECTPSFQQCLISWAVRKGTSEWHSEALKY
jgi:hypothetical protein